jgi:hypothetical protein
MYVTYLKMTQFKQVAIHDDAVYVFHVSLLLFLDWLVYKKIIGKSVCFTNALKP